jgi:hypothetical protein
VKIAYDRGTGSLSIILKEGVAVAESVEDKPGVIFDYDEHGDSSPSKFSTRRAASATPARSSTRPREWRPNRLVLGALSERGREASAIAL